MQVPSAGDELSVKPGGILVAVVGFVLTRFLLAGAVYGMPDDAGTAAAAARLVPLALGLSVTLYGVNLAVSTRDRAYAMTVARWYLLGVAGMTGVVWLAAVGTGGGMFAVSDGTVAASAVAAGGAGGVLVGVRSAGAHRQRRSLARANERTVLLNRLLRHEVRNALTAVRGHSEALFEGSAPDAERSRRAVADGLDRIARTVDEVGFLVRTVGDERDALSPIRLAPALESCRERLPAGAAAGEDVFETVSDVSVRADAHLETAVGELLALPVGRPVEDDAEVAVRVGDRVVEVAVTAPGAWLTDRERGVLADGVPEYEYNDVDYGIPVLRLLVTGYGGRVRVEEADGRTTVTAEFLRTGERAPPGDSPGVAGADLWSALGVGLVAGVAMGLAMEAVAGSFAVVGALYGAPTGGVSWVAHLFHSAVFATVYVAAVSKTRLARLANRPLGGVAVATGYALLLWLLAAGVVMGLWLNAVGVPAMLPNRNRASLVGHLVWGVTLGTLYALVPREAVAERVGSLRARLAARFDRG